MNRYALQQASYVTLLVSQMYTETNKNLALWHDQWKLFFDKQNLEAHLCRLSSHTHSV